MTSTVAKSKSQPEPWLRGTLSDVPAVIRGVLHALELAREDAYRWCGDLTGVEVIARPVGLPSAAFLLRHIAGSLDRLLTYAEGRGLAAEQLAALAHEEEGGAVPHVLLREFDRAIERAMHRVQGFIEADLEQARFVGRAQLPATLGGLLVHIADHTQRHIGQLVTTAKLLKASRSATTSQKAP